MIKKTNGEFELKLIDFGLSHIPSSFIAQSHENCGTLLYQAPELAGDRDYNENVDIWSVGVI
jgi:serine/threonine protein kinase